LRDPLSTAKVNNVPSPDNYNPNYETIFKKTGVFSVGRSKRLSPERKNFAPGPG